jgi:prophage regulatory protein
MQKFPKIYPKAEVKPAPETNLSKIVSDAVDAAFKRAGLVSRDEVQPAAPRMVNKHQVCKMVGISQATLWRWCEAGKFPYPYRLARARLWKEAEVIDWLDRRCAEIDAGRGE